MCARRSEMRWLALIALGGLTGPRRCLGLDKQHKRADEFEALRDDSILDVEAAEALKPSRCEPADDSAKWSCVRRIPRKVCKERHANNGSHREGAIFGYTAAQGKWKIGSTEDHAFNFQIKGVPQLSKGPGFLKMNMTERLRDRLLQWYQKRLSAGDLVDEEPVPGGYLNDEYVKAGIVNLDFHRKVQTAIAKEMQQIMEWWTQRKLEHHATFGVRSYGRGASLLNHVDRYDTHLASAVLQVSQRVDADGGWPLEVISDQRECYEVYLQPGQMVLYEGAHFKHGRPMVFRGDHFANIFSHFAPVGWQFPHSEL